MSQSGFEWGLQFVSWDAEGVTQGRRLGIDRIPAELRQCKRLRSLRLSNQALERLENLPESLKELVVAGNRLMGLDGLPSGLRVLRANNNRIVWLDSLPEGLLELNLAKNDLMTWLPTLPPTLVVLRVQGCGLMALPELPATLRELAVGSNPITIWPQLPAGLKTLSADNTGMAVKDPEDLPQLPAGLEFLNISNNSLPALPCFGRCSWTNGCRGCLPSTLQRLDVSRNPLNALPPLPRLRSLDVHGTNLRELPPLPSSLLRLSISWHISPAPLPPFLQMFVVDYLKSTNPRPWTRFLPPYLTIVSVATWIELTNAINSGCRAAARRGQDRALASLVVRGRLRQAVPEVTRLVQQYL